MRTLVTMLGDSVDGLLLLDADGVVVIANPAAEALFGLGTTQMVGTSFGLPADASGGPSLIDVVRAGNAHTLEMRSASTDWAGRDATVVSLRDVTARLETERSLRSFVQMASHELRTPLTTVVGFTSTMLEHWDDLADDRKLHYLRVIEDQTARLGRLAEALLRAARAEAGAVHLELAPVDLAATIRRAVQSVGMDVQVRLPVRGDAPFVRGDADRVQEMVINYLGNASKYGEPPFGVDVAPRGDRWLTTVVDAGPGVDRSFVGSLFTRFARDSDHHASSQEGSGLGLAIVRALANAMGGEAWYEPNPGGGSRFMFSLPAVDPPSSDDD